MWRTKLSLVFLVIPLWFGVFSFSAQAYTIDTHAYLTYVALDLYNKSFPNQKIPEAYRGFLIDGSRREDDAPRWMNHFYDPVHERGLTAVGFGVWAESKEWAQMGDLQNEIKYRVPATIASILRAIDQGKISELSTETNYEWRQAIQYYLWGEKEKAMFVLGHILHLIEDLSVPDHTRNDPHASGSPYEDWAGNFTLGHNDADFPERLINRTPAVYIDLDSYFINLAKYSNANFYSADTIGIQSGFGQPQPVDYERRGDYMFALNRDSDGTFPLFKQSNDSGFIQKNIYEIAFDDDDIMSAYWSRLSTKAVQYSAGVINFFFHEAEKAKDDPSYSKEKPKSTMARVIDFTQGTVGGLLSQMQSSFSGLNETIDASINSIKTSFAKLMVGQDSADPIFAIPFERLRSNMERFSTEAPAMTETEATVELKAILDAFNKYDLPIPKNDAFTEVTSTPLSQPLPTEKVSDASTEISESGTTTPPAIHITYGGSGVVLSNSDSVVVTSSVPNPESQISLLRIAYSSSTAELFFDWSALIGERTTSTVEYELKDTTNESMMIYRGPSTDFRMRISEVGRNYRFTVREFMNGEAIGSSAETEIAVPSFLSETFFYHKASGTPSGNVVEFAYDRNPFVPDIFWAIKDSTYKLVFVYLNSEPPTGDDDVNLMSGFEPNNRENLMTFNFKRCYNSRTPGDILMFPDPNGVCGYGGPYTIAISGSEREDNRVQLPVVSPARDFSSDDFITFAFYAFQDSGPASSFRRVAVDKKHYHFRDTEPDRKAPHTLTDLELSFGKFRSVLDVVWPYGSDPDSSDETLSYEYNFGISPGMDSAGWEPVSSWYNRNISVPVEAGNSYTIGVRVRDQEGNISDPIVREWRYPSEYIPLPHQRGHADDIGAFGSGQKIVMPRDASVNGVSLYLGVVMNYMTYSRTNVNIYSDRDGEPGDLMASSDPIPQTWVTTIGSEISHMETKELSYDFPAPVALSAGQSYWLVSGTAQGNQAYGMRMMGLNGNPYPEGGLQGNTDGDAYFFLREVE